ncbi:MAG: ArsA family ATPase [Cyanobacteria bacterium J06641_5]
MASILTFLGKGGTGRTTLAIAAARQLAVAGRRILLVSSEPDPSFGKLLDWDTPTPDPQNIGANLDAVQLQSATLLERSWEEVKKLEAQYLRSPTLKQVYGQELSILPGMDRALALNALREFDASNRYDTIVFDGAGDLSMLRTFGMPESVSWYARRFRKVFFESDLGRTVMPFVQPLTSAVLNTGWSPDNLEEQQPVKAADNLLERGKAAVGDRTRMAAYLVATPDPLTLATAKYLWGSAQQIGLTVGGLLLNRTNDTAAAITEEFAPLPTIAVPDTQDGQAIGNALPDLLAVGPDIPGAVTVDVAAKQVRLFLPGIAKKQVKLTQYGPELTIEAGDQRRNLALPPQLSGKPVTGAKFQNGFLIVSF